VKTLVDNETWKKYAKFLSKSFVENSKETRWCPSPGCNKAVYDPILEAEDNYVGICTCGMRFCWKCGKPSHTPATCKNFEDWQAKYSSDDVLSIRYIQQNTKQCPKCKNAIEKNDGCFMMTCQQCHQQFCWLCLQDWSTHGDHFKCAKYNDGALQNKPEFREGQKVDFADLDDTYIFYLERYKNYENALKYEKDLNDKVKNLSKIVEKEKGVLCDFLKESVDQLHLCRTLIMNLFIYQCFSHLENEKKNLTDTEIGTLEMITERLANLLEKQLDIKYVDDNKEAWTFHIKKVTKAAQKFVTTILEGNF